MVTNLPRLGKGQTNYWCLGLLCACSAYLRRLGDVTAGRAVTPQLRLSHVLHSEQSSSHEGYAMPEVTELEL